MAVSRYRDPKFLAVQAGRQDLAAGGQQKNMGARISQTQYWMYAATGGQTWNGGPGTTAPLCWRCSSGVPSSISASHWHSQVRTVSHAMYCICWTAGVCSSIATAGANYNKRTMKNFVLSTGSEWLILHYYAGCHHPSKAFSKTSRSAIRKWKKTRATMGVGKTIFQGGNSGFSRVWQKDFSRGGQECWNFILPTLKLGDKLFFYWNVNTGFFKVF